MMPLAEGTPIKERMLDDIRQAADSRGRVALSSAQLARRHGLSGHDATKNLDQLRKEGFIDFAYEDKGGLVGRIRLRRGALNESVLAAAKPVHHDYTHQILTWIESQPGGTSGAWVELPNGWNTVADALKTPDKQRSVAVTASRLAAKGVLEARRENRRVVAVRKPLRGTTVGRSEQPTVVHPVRPSVSQGVATPIREPLPDMPNLDAYVSARRIARLAPANNPYITVDFTENPIAEEAIKLREWVAALNR